MKTPSLDTLSPKERLFLDKVKRAEPAAFEVDMRRLITASNLLEQGFVTNEGNKVRLTPVGSLIISVADKNCRSYWHTGVLISPDGEKPSGWCTQPTNHEGDHIFPNNNRQPNRTRDQT